MVSSPSLSVVVRPGGPRLPRRLTWAALRRQSVSAYAESPRRDIRSATGLAGGPAVPFAQVGGANLYQYALSSPTTYTDPTGNNPQERGLQVRQLEEAGVHDRASGGEGDLYLRQRDDLTRECERLRERVETLTAAVEEAVRERNAVQRRCVELEAELAAAQDLAEREELRRQQAEERLRLAKAAGVTEQRLADLERAQRESEQGRLAAARDAAARLEDAEAKAREIIEAASSRVTRIRPSVVSRSAALRLLRDVAVDIAERRLPMLEPYERIELSGAPEAGIHGRAVTDLVHLLAELLRMRTCSMSSVYWRN
ncbi:hypothetical protein M2160_008590 [Streptomyces sp. SAI-117]|uniref:hypothetical protein n=1 Tax=Streptomyces sp. SAI-117 TaxID=2940546 RepID=UPI002476E364|nr:hypothetical protein [Streptomyces sp. SAI-117]MDH6573483.1 hypothetical protein [Streptomyces sp. SAI-117]